MENDKNPKINTDKKNSDVWNSVTPLSKYLAIALFVALPFIGSWVGYSFAPDKVVEVEKVVEVKDVVEVEKVLKVEPEVELKQRTLQNQEPSEVLVSDYRISNFNTTYGGSRFGKVAISSDGTKKYLMQLPYTESVCCEYLHYSQVASSDNGFAEIEEIFSLEEAGLLYQRKWPVSEDNNYIVVSTFSDKALILCDQGKGLENKRANNVLNIVNTNTAKVRTIYVDEYNAIDFSVLKFSDDDTEVVVEQTTYPIDEENECANNLLPGDTKTVSYPINI